MEEERAGRGERRRRKIKKRGNKVERLKVKNQTS
jgi:hypothetical protein